MLIRIRGGDSGSCDYLVTGRKQGRQFTRDELDERVVLAGDLALTDSIIRSLDGAGEKCLNITLGFKEDGLSVDVLKAITEEAKDFFMAAYGADEFNFYAEAHLPKIKSYTNAATGEFVERMMHIHIVIPKINLLSQQHLNPFGMVEWNERFIDAFQEHINNKYGLASPKDNPRYEFTDQSEMISRYKGDLFKSQRSDLRKEFLGQVIANRIESWADFKAMLEEYGRSNEVNGKHAKYMHFKPAEGRGVNLTERVFSREFIQLPTEEKIKRLAPEMKRSYIAQAQAKRDPEHISDALKEWRQIRAKELKYINSGNRSLYARYRAAEEAGKLEILTDRETLFHDQYGDKHESDRKPYLGQNRRQPPPFRRDRLHTLSELDVVRHAGSSEMLLPHHVSGQLEHVRANGNRHLRWHPDSGRNDSVVGQAIREFDELHIQRQEKSLSKWDKIKRELDARQLLDYLAKTSYGLIVEKYVISKAEDGGDRILCGRHRLNVSDFLTREMKLSWAEASPILEKLYAEQVQHTNIQTNAWQMYLAFRAEQQPTIAIAREKIAQEHIVLRDKQKQERAFQRIQHKAARSSLSNSNEWRGKSGELKVAKMLLTKHQADEKAALQARQKAALDSLALPKLPSYMEWLSRHLEALNEFAASSPSNITEIERERLSAAEALAATELKEAKLKAEKRGGASIAGDGAISPIRTDIRDYRAHADIVAGTVSFISTSGKVAFTDVGHKIDVAATRDPDAVLAALQLATQKFGPGITINGDAEFQKLCVRIAAEHGIRFKNDALNLAVAAERERILLESARPANTENGRYDGTVIAVTDADVYLRIPKSGAVKIARQNLPDISYIGNGERRIIILHHGVGTIQNPNQTKERGGRQ